MKTTDFFLRVVVFSYILISCSILQSCDGEPDLSGIGNVFYGTGNNPPGPDTPPDSPPPGLGILWAEFEKDEVSSLGQPQWNQSSTGVAFRGISRGSFYDQIYYLPFRSDRIELLVSFQDEQFHWITGLEFSRNERMYFIDWQGGNAAGTLSRFNLETKVSENILGNIPSPIGRNVLDISPNDHHLLINSDSGSITVDLQTLEHEMWNSELGCFSLDKPAELVLLTVDYPVWFWRFIDMELRTFEDHEFSSIIPGLQPSESNVIHDFKVVNNEINLLWERETDDEQFLVNSKTGGAYYNFRVEHYGNLFYTPQYYFSNSYNKCIAVTQVPSTNYHFQIELLDFKNGTRKILIDTFNKKWYSYYDFAFTDDETKVVYIFQDRFNMPDVVGIYWLEIDS